MIRLNTCSRPCEGHSSPIRGTEHRSESSKSIPQCSAYDISCSAGSGSVWGAECYCGVSRSAECYCGMSRSGTVRDSTPLLRPSPRRPKCRGACHIRCVCSCLSRIDFFVKGKTQPISDTTTTTPYHVEQQQPTTERKDPGRGAEETTRTGGGGEKEKRGGRG